MAKNCMKTTKSTFFGQSSGGGKRVYREQANFLGSRVGQQRNPEIGIRVNMLYLPNHLMNVSIAINNC